MKLLMKSKWRGVFQVYRFDFEQKEGSVKNYPSLSAIKAPCTSRGFSFTEGFTSTVFLRLF